MHASESVLVIGELLCTGVQSKRRETHKERNARNVLMLGMQTTTTMSCWTHTHPLVRLVKKTAQVKTHNLIRCQLVSA